MILSLLSNIKLKHILIIIGIGLLTYSFYAHKTIIELESDNARITDNFNNALKIDSLEVVIYKITKDQELKDITSQNKGLQNLVERVKRENRVKEKHIQNIYYQQQRFIDSISKSFDVSKIVQGVRNDVPITEVWRDSTECFDIRGTVTYANDSLKVNVLSKENNNETVLIKSKGRRKPVKWLLGLRLGKREDKFTPKSKCGDSKVTIIEKE